MRFRISQSLVETARQRRLAAIGRSAQGDNVFADLDSRPHDATVMFISTRRAVQDETKAAA